jgi:hypothetical protein
MTAATPVAGDSWNAACRIADLPCRAASRRPISLQQLLPPSWGEVVVDDVVLAITNAILCGSLQHPAGQVAVQVQGGWIEATICDRAALPPTSLLATPLRGVRGG